MGKSCHDMAEALRDCMFEQECMADGTRTLKQCLRDRKYAHECAVSGFFLALVIDPFVLTR